MIDYGLTWNLISQLFIFKYEVSHEREVSSRFKTVNKDWLEIYGSNAIFLTVQNEVSKASTMKQNFLEVNISGKCWIILGLLWLKAAKPMINWDTKTFSFKKS